MSQSHHQLQDTLDVGLATQALVHIMHFDIKQTHHQLQDALGVGLATDFCIMDIKFSMGY